MAAAVAKVVLITTVTSFLAYVLVAFSVETVLILGFGRWEPLPEIVPHSDIAMVYASAFIAGIPLVRLRRKSVPPLAVPIGATLVWGVPAMLGGLTWWIAIGFAGSAGLTTLLGYAATSAIFRHRQE